MDFNVTKEQWIDRYVIHFSQLQPGLEPGGVIGKAAALWASHGQLEPEAVAASQFAQRSRNGGLDDPFEATLGLSGGEKFERTERCRRLCPRRRRMDRALRRPRPAARSHHQGR